MRASLSKSTAMRTEAVLEAQVGAAGCQLARRSGAARTPVISAIMYLA
jgi:L,D-peptidoglycan transpeptidase YkuD (ErfK/YbiS/YcfS/YnhG family)